MFKPETGKPVDKGAIISDDGRYRYMLWRIWDYGLPCLGFVLLNPSTADAQQDDPTIEWCCRFADAHDFGGIMVTNLCALRSSDPRALERLEPGDAEGIENGRHIQSMAQQCATIIVGWGNGGFLQPHAKLAATAGLATAGDHVFCLGRTKTREPTHPAFFVRSPNEKVNLQRWQWGA